MSLDAPPTLIFERRVHSWDLPGRETLQKVKISVEFSWTLVLGLWSLLLRSFLLSFGGQINLTQDLHFLESLGDPLLLVWNVTNARDAFFLLSDSSLARIIKGLFDQRALQRLTARLVCRIKLLRLAEAQHLDTISENLQMFALSAYHLFGLALDVDDLAEAFLHRILSVTLLVLQVCW